jgi:hypothetical protein
MKERPSIREFGIKLFPPPVYPSIELSFASFGIARRTFAGSSRVSPEFDERVEEMGEGGGSGGGLALRSIPD